MGPVKALTYLLIYGVLSLVLGTCWSLKLPWALCIPLASGARCVASSATLMLQGMCGNP